MGLWMALLLYQLEPPGPWMGEEQVDRRSQGSHGIQMLPASSQYPHHARLLGHFISFLVTKNCQLFGWFLGKLLFHRKKYMKNGSICRTNVFLEGLRFRVVFINHHEEQFSVCDNA